MRYSGNASEFFKTRIIEQKPDIDPVRKRRRMIKNLQAAGIVNPAVLRAMEQVPRHLFVPEVWQPHAYESMPLPIGYGQTISNPLVVARMLEHLNPESGMRVLEIGSGSGYQTALLAAMGCVVYGVERLRELFRSAVSRIDKLGLRNVHFLCSDGTLGLADAAPYERIIVAAGGPDIPAPLVEQLDVGGKMIIPAGQRQRSQRLWLVEKQRDKVVRHDLGDATFVDLVGDHGWGRKDRC